MALKLNIKPELESEMDKIFPKTGIRSKTEYINKAIAAYNALWLRRYHLRSLKTYFKASKQDSQDILNEFHNIAKISD